MTNPSPPLALAAGESAAGGIRRIVAELVADAIWRLENVADLGTAASVHETRKRCKEARGVIRLGRGGLGDGAFRAANGTLRDAARLLSDLRDDQAMLDTFDALVNASAGSIPPSGVGAVRNELRRRAIAAGRATELRRSKLTAAHRMLRDVGAQVREWNLSGEGDAMLADGLRQTAARAHQAMAAAEATGAPHDYHDWRKRVKDGWYHAQVLEPAAPSMLTWRAAMLHRLSDGLGDLNDLEVILETARLDPGGFGGAEQLATLQQLVSPMRHELERRALTLGRRLHSESADAYGERMLGYLDVWRRTGAELPVGAIAESFAQRDVLDELTKAELRTLAAEACIGGRWAMTRAELLAALRAAGRSRVRSPIGDRGA